MKPIKGILITRADSIYMVAITNAASAHIAASTYIQYSMIWVGLLFVNAAPPMKNYVNGDLDYYFELLKEIKNE